MRALSPQQYQQLEQLAQAYLRQHAHEYKSAKGRNPHLGVDALCFQQHAEGLLGALITPVSLSLVLVPAAEAANTPPTGADRHILSLPNGRYPLEREVLESGEMLWRCELLDDLSMLSGPDDASRLAQQLMQRVMTPADSDAGE